MNGIRELAEEFGVKAEPLIQAVEAAKRARRYWEGEHRVMADAEPAECAHRLEQTHKAIAALPLRARAHLHWRLAERLARGLPTEQRRRLMEDTDLVAEILAALTEPLDTEREDPQQQLKWFVQAWQEAGGQLLVDDRYDLDLIEFLRIAYRHLGETLSEDAIRRRLDRIRRDPLDSEG